MIYPVLILLKVQKTYAQQLKNFWVPWLAYFNTIIVKI